MKIRMTVEVEVNRYGNPADFSEVRALSDLETFFQQEKEKSVQVNNTLFSNWKLLKTTVVTPKSKKNKAKKSTKEDKQTKG
jgi:hypothetical protein